MTVCLTSVHAAVEFLVAHELANVNALRVGRVAHGRTTALRALMTATRAQNVADTIATNGVVDLVDLVGIDFAAHEWFAGTTAATRHQHLFETGLARAVVTLFFAVVSATLE